MVEKLSARLHLSAQAVIGEGPRWDDRKNELLWVDILGRRIHRLSVEEKTSSEIRVGSDVGVADLRNDGGYVLAVREGFAAIESDGTGYRQLCRIPTWQDPEIRMNDGACDPAGRFWAGSMHNTKSGAGSLYCLDANGTMTTKLENVSIANGIGWSGDTTTMYFIDSPTQMVMAFDFDTDSGDISNPRCLVTIDSKYGMPDGLAIDTEDHIWVTLYGGGAVHRYSPVGRLDAIVSVPVPNTTSCAFGGENLSTLFITSARAGLSKRQLDEHPLSGSIFECDVSVRGKPGYRFGL
jgi:sugar lactone lactonase YvrE